MARQTPWKMLVVGVAVAGLAGASAGTAAADTPVPTTPSTTVLASDDDFFFDDIFDDHGRRLFFVDRDDCFVFGCRFFDDHGGPGRH
jgi:hypothetical protein